MTIRTEGGGAPQADVSDVTIRNNIIRHVGAGISLSGSDGGAGIQSARIKISNNLFDDVNGPAYGDLNVDGPNDGTFLKIGEPKDVWIDHNTIFQTGPVTWAFDVTNGFIFTNNIVQSFVSAGGYQGIYGPGQMQGNATFAKYFPDVTDANQHFHHNILIGGNASKYSNFNNLSENYFPNTISDVGFTDFLGGEADYHGYNLSASSPYANISDGSNPGVDFIALDSALYEFDRGCTEIPTSVSQPALEETTYLLFPNPTDASFAVKGSRFSTEPVQFTVMALDGSVLYQVM